jgi:hypothetical protein
LPIVDLLEPKESGVHETGATSASASLRVAACGESAPDPTAQLTDETLESETHAGRLAYELERDEEAVTEYRAGLSRAQARDDLEAIGNIGDDITVAE